MVSPKREGFGPIVRDDDRRECQLGQQCSQFSTQARACRRIQGREGFIEQQQLRSSAHRARKRDPLLLSTGQLRGLACLKSVTVATTQPFHGHASCRAAVGRSLNPYSMLPVTVCVGKSA